LAARRSASASASRSESAGGRAPHARPRAALRARDSDSPALGAPAASRAGGVLAGPTTFARRVVAVTRSIPRGRVATYGDVAVLAGRPGAARAVGNIMAHCEAPTIPCHRVIAAGGDLGGYTDLVRKKQQLAAEGVTFSGRRIRQFRELRWTGDTPATLRRRRPV